MSSRAGRAFAALVAVTALAACALTNKSDPVIFRYFTPEGLDRGDPSPRVASVVAVGAAGAELQLRFGPVTAAVYLKERIAFRDSSFEVGYLEDARWTERPETFVRRALSRALFEKRGIQQIVSGPGPILEVELEAFDELRAPRHAARLALTWSLADDEVVRAQERITIEKELSSKVESSPSDVARALSLALDEAVSRIATRVTTLLPTLRALQPPPAHSPREAVDAGADARAR